MLKNVALFAAGMCTMAIASAVVACSIFAALGTGAYLYGFRPGSVHIYGGEHMLTATVISQGDTDIGKKASSLIELQHILVDGCLGLSDDTKRRTALHGLELIISEGLAAAMAQDDRHEAPPKPSQDPGPGLPSDGRRL